MNALKKPVLDESIILEATPSDPYMRSESTPNIPDKTEEDGNLRNGRDFHFRYESPIPFLSERTKYGTTPTSQRDNLDILYYARPRRASAGGILVSSVRDMTAEEQYPFATQLDAGSTEKNMTVQWVSKLPDNGRRLRSHTEPILPPESVFRNENKRSTLPRFVSPPPPTTPPSEQQQQHQQQHKRQSLPRDPPQTDPVPSTTTSRSRTVSAEEQTGSSTAAHLLSASSSAHQDCTSSRKKAFTMSSTSHMAALAVSPGQLSSTTLVKVYMNRVQKGVWLAIRANYHRTSSLKIDRLVGLLRD